MSRRWLLRTTGNQILGPYGDVDVQKMLHDGKLVGSDELCPAGGYWFFLRETEEVAKAFGPEVAKLLFASVEETTETQISRGKSSITLAQAAAPPPQRRMERAGLLQVIIWVLVGLAGLVLGVVLKLLFSAR